MTYENSGTGIDYAQLIERVLTDDLAMTYFTERWERLSYTLFDLRERPPMSIRVSDAGECAQKLWAELHGLLDIADNPAMIDDKMQPGTLDGARTACLIAAGIARWHWPLTAMIEEHVDANGVPGHTDVLICAEPEVIEVIECKMSMYPKGIGDPSVEHRYWLHQACKYALGWEAPFFVLLVHAPASFTAPTRRSFRYATVEYAVETDREYDRLRTAQRDDAPEPDAPEDQPWRCKSCRYSQCSEGRNVNPRRKMTEVIVDEIGIEV